MECTTIEQHLDNLKITFDQLLEDVGDRTVARDEFKYLFLDKVTKNGVEREKFEDVLTDIELLFDNVPDGEYNTLFINYFEEISKLNGHGFESWLNDITFNGQIEDDIKISFLCYLYDFELIQWILNALENCATNPKQEILVLLQSYLNLVEGYFSKALNIILYAMTFPSGILELNYKDSKGNNQRIKVKNYKDVSTTSLNNKLLLLNSANHKELGKIAEACNKNLRNAVAHHSFTLDETNQKIIYKNGELQFSDFKIMGKELSDSELILVHCFNYYAMKCYFESNG